MKENYIVPLMTVFTVSPVRALMTSATGQGVGSNLSDPTILSGDFGDYFD